MFFSSQIKNVIEGSYLPKNSKKSVIFHFKFECDDSSQNAKNPKFNMAFLVHFLALGFYSSISPW
jgi:hypothetical protein